MVEATFQQLELLSREIIGRVIRKRTCSGGLTCTGVPEEEKIEGHTRGKVLVYMQKTRTLPISGGQVLPD